MEVLVLDQTRPDVKMPVVKVIVPGLRHFRARFAPGRLYDVPVQMGWEERSLAEEELNPIPVFDLECFSGQPQGGIMSQAYVLSFAEGVTVDKPSGDCAVIQMPVTHRVYTFKTLTPGLRQAIDVLSSTGATEDELAGLVEELDGASALARLYYYLLTFAECRILNYGISCGDQRLATLAPVSTSFSFSPEF